MKKWRSTAFVVMLCANAIGAGDSPYRLEKLLGMDDVSSKSAIAPLEEVLREGGSSIGPCAAAQALFLMDTPESKAILKKWLWYPHYDLDYSISLAFHWGIMELGKRGGFIREYHLNSRSDDVAISIKAAPVTSNSHAKVFTISLLNSSGKKLRLYRPHVYLGEHILLVAKDGEVMQPERTTDYTLLPRPPEQAFPEIAPDEYLAFSFTAETKTYPNSPYAGYRNYVWLDCGDFSHKLTHSGTFMVYARYKYGGSKDPPFDNIWTGRVVSAPIEIEISDANRPAQASEATSKPAQGVASSSSQD